MIDFKTASLEELLNHKTIYYDKIDFSIIEKSWKTLSSHIKLPFVIHIVGTNGKGSTGRFLAHYLYKKSFKVLHYSSPHILNFNERIWMNGRDSANLELEIAHKTLQDILDIHLLEKLTYFEYTTLLALILSSSLDYLILEAGLGGEFDATNVVKNDLSLITTIDLDHQDFLGDTIEEIAKTKMRSVDTKMLIGFQTHSEVYDVAQQVKLEKKQEFNKEIVIKAVKEFDKYSLNDKFPSYLKTNLHLVVEVLKELNIDIDLSIFDEVELFGRCQKIRPNVTIDVGHNPLAAKVIAKEFENKKVHLVYNSYANKDYKEVLNILKPIISEMTILELSDKRVVDKENLLEICESLNIILSNLNKIEKTKEYLIFGSFLVVENFFKNLGIYEK
jgi:dihydrofolate synthase / folylpolyglutamate synthase